MIVIIDDSSLTLRLLVPFCLPHSLCILARRVAFHASLPPTCAHCFSVAGASSSLYTSFCPLPLLLPLHFLTWSLNSYRLGRRIDET